MLILKAIVARDGIAVDEVDLENRIKEKAVEFGTTPHELKSQLEKGGGRERLRDMLIAEQTLGYLHDIVFKTNRNLMKGAKMKSNRRNKGMKAAAWAAVGGVLTAATIMTAQPAQAKSAHAATHSKNPTSC